MSDEKIEIPAEVQKMLDLASENEQLAVIFTAHSVQLKNTRENILIREFEWNRVNDFARNMLGNVLGAQK